MSDKMDKMTTSMNEKMDSMNTGLNTKMDTRNTKMIGVKCSVSSELSNMKTIVTTVGEGMTSLQSTMCNVKGDTGYLRGRVAAKDAAKIKELAKKGIPLEHTMEKTNHHV